MAHHFVSLFLFISIVGYNFEFSNSYALDNTQLEELDQTSFDDDVALIPRQEDDEEEEEDRKQVVSGIGNILTGAFSLNLNKILKGAFSFADQDVQDNILSKLFFKVPTTTLKPKIKTVANVTIDPNNTAVTRRRRSTQPVVGTELPVTSPVTFAPAEGPEDEDEDS